jgi:glycosyltransferase involved in cell wall biosynthesis
MKKICLISAIYEPHKRGGAETVFKNIVSGLRETDHDIFVITIDKWQGFKSLKPRIETINNVRVYRFYALNLFSYININNYSQKHILRLIWHGLDMVNLHSYFVVKSILKKEKPNVVLTHTLKGIGYTICRSVKSLKIKNIHTLHDVQLVTPTGLIIKGKEKNWQHTFFLTKLYEFLNKKILGSPDIVVSSSNFLMDFYTEKGFFPKSKKMIIHNPVNIQTKNPSETKKITEEFNFLFLGQLETHKGILLLIETFKKLLGASDQKPNLLIAGTGSAEEESRKNATGEENIKFLGYIPNNKLADIFSQTNALIIPSLCLENSPTVIFESLATGTPVLAAKIGGIEFIKDGYNGFTFEAGDKEDLLRILKLSLAKKTELQEMSENCTKSVSEIGISEYIKKLENII